MTRGKRTRRPGRRPIKKRWKVVLWDEDNRRWVYGQKYAKQAWFIFWLAYRSKAVVRVELWRARQMLMQHGTMIERFAPWIMVLLHCDTHHRFW